MERRLLLCALAVGAFALALAYTSRQESLRRSAAAPATPAAVPPHESMAMRTGEPAPPTAAMHPPPIIAPPPLPEQIEPQGEPDSADVANGERENGKMLDQTNRGTERSARAR